MVKMERKFYSEEFKERELMSYSNGKGSESMSAGRFPVIRETFVSCAYRKRRLSDSGERVEMSPPGTDFMKREALTPKAKEVRIQELEESPAKGKIRLGCPGTMTEIAGHALKIGVVKKKRSQTVHGMRRDGTSYGTEALCRLSGKSRRAYCERSHYVASPSAEEDTELSPSGEARKTFPRMETGKEPVSLKPKFEAMYLSTQVGTPSLSCCTVLKHLHKT
jgi:hypothetical protein